MNLKTVNRIFGYGFFGIGAIRIIYIILLFSQMVTNVNIALNGGEWSYGLFPIITVLISWLQILLTIGSVIMIFVNTIQQPKVIIGYVWGLGAMFLSFIIPSWPWLIIGTFFIQCGMLMKAGTEIMSNSDTYKNEFRPKTSKKQLKIQNGIMERKTNKMNI